VSAPESKPDPRKPPRIVVYDKTVAAQAQLETAITLWFNYGDPISIHALAAAANECFHAIGKNKGLPTIIQTWKRSLTNKQLKQANKVQNFAKHARTDPDGRVPVVTEYGDLLILDSVMCQAKLFQLWTPLMRCFYTRFALENATLLGRFVPLATREYFRKAVEVYELGDGSRVDYLKQVLPTLRAHAGESEPLLEPPP
jgi:hypothetical protein